MNRCINLLLLFIACFLLVACSDDKKEEEPLPVPPPVITLDSESGVYVTKVGKSLTLRPDVENTAGAEYTWTLNEEVVGTDSVYVFAPDVEGSYFFEFRVTTPGGSAEKVIRVDVGKKALPVISFALPGSGVKVVAATDYVFRPDVQNNENAVYEWYLGNDKVGSGEEYTFNQAELGEYQLTLIVVNEDGQDEKQLTVEVVERQPLQVEFLKSSLLAENTDCYVFKDGTICLTPWIENAGEGTTYEWSVNGEIVECKDRVFAFEPAGEGTFTVSVQVVDADQARAKMISRNIQATSIVRQVATVQVICRGDEMGAFRAATGTSAAESNRVYEYLPAPGQFINEYKEAGMGDFTVSTQKEACDYAARRLENHAYVSLGGFGGYIIVGFDHSVLNSGAYEGYDFAIEGNAFDGSSEPGIVWVMQDVNGNGLPDDTWYQLKGSEYGKEETIETYAVTYYRPAGVGMNVGWSDNCGNTGVIDYLAEYHSQNSYYPAWVTEDSYTLRGVCLKARNRFNGSIWVNENYDWGYVDNMGSDRLSTSVNPDAEPVNVYFKISNAVYANGEATDLKYIDFVKIQTGVNAKSGIIGEVSTEVFSVTDKNVNN